MSTETISTRVYERNGVANLTHGEKTRTTLVNKTLLSVLQITLVLINFDWLSQSFHVLQNIKAGEIGFKRYVAHTHFVIWGGYCPLFNVPTWLRPCLRDIFNMCFIYYTFLTCVLT